MNDLTITTEVALGFFGSCIGVGAIVGLVVSLFNSWTP